MTRAVINVRQSETAWFYVVQLLLHAQRKNVVRVNNARSEGHKLKYLWDLA